MATSVGRAKFSCKFPGCKNLYLVNIKDDSYQNKHFYKFPKNPDLCKIWKEICKISGKLQSHSLRLCEDHFLDSCFINITRHKLNYNAIPSAVDADTYVNLPQHSLHIMDHDYAGNICEIAPTKDISSDITDQGDAPENIYMLLKCRGILSEIGLTKKQLTPKKGIMYKIHRNITSKLSKLKTKLNESKNQFKILKNLYKHNAFEVVEEELGEVSKIFIRSQLNNACRKPSGRRWTVDDKAFALSLYKRSPKLYRYLQANFQLPSPRLLRSILAKIPLETGFSSCILEHLKSKVQGMYEHDRYCSLIFDEMSLSVGFDYQANKQKIYGYEDIGHLGRTQRTANHALVFMVRGLRKSWKQIIAYYFTANTIQTINLKKIIIELISQLQNIGLKVVATVCDQGTTNQAALSQLCRENRDRPSPYYFLVNGERVVIIFDVPHLLKNTRNALLRCKIQFEDNKVADFNYVKNVFQLDQQKSFKLLPRLRPEYFNSKDSYLKMKVKVAAQQLSHTVAAAIEAYASLVNPLLPPQSVFTAEFIENIDSLFDSLNSSHTKNDAKKYRCAVTENSPHLELWSKLLIQIKKWKLIETETGKDCTNQYSFVAGWQTTLQSVIYLWNTLKSRGFNYLCTRALNQDPVENLFCIVRQHGVSNINPTCHQFMAALKTIIINDLGKPNNLGNCEQDNCKQLLNLKKIIEVDLEVNSVDENVVCSKSQLGIDFGEIKNMPVEDTQALAYVSGYILKKIIIPDNCTTCRDALYVKDVTSSHLFVSFKEYDETQRLNYASEKVMFFVQSLHDKLYAFLNNYGHLDCLEDRFKTQLNSSNTINFCLEHDCGKLIIDISLSFLIYKYIKDKKQNPTLFTSGHVSKMKKFKALHPPT